MTKDGTELIEAVCDWWAPQLTTESPIEEIFAYAFTKYHAPRVALTSQVAIGRYRLDFVADDGTHRIAFECDGKEFHRSPADDAERDAFIVANSDVSTVYRLRGADIFSRIEGAILIVGLAEPWLLSGRSREILRRLTLQLPNEELRLTRHCLSGRSWFQLNGFLPPQPPAITVFYTGTPTLGEVTQ